MSARRKPPRPPRWSSCMVLDLEGGQDRVWQFAAGSGDQLAFQGESSLAKLGKSSLQRGWRQIFQPRLNLAWLPADQVYLRVLRLPAAEASELRPMVELQLEKISPLPVTQMVWSYQAIECPDPDARTVVVVLATRAAVEAFLGQLEQNGFLADRLEVPLLHYLDLERPSGSLTRLHLQPTGTTMLCLAAWWQHGRLESLDLIRVPNTSEGPSLLTRHLNRQAWAGEMEGWLTTLPPWELIIDPDAAPSWESALRGWATDESSVRPAPTGREVASLSARRATRNQSTVNMLPDDHSARYRQQYVDRLWMRGLAAAVACYLLGVVAYAAGVQYYGYQAGRLRSEVAKIGPAYTNALVLRERLRVFQEQSALKYAALDCLLAVSERLPHVITLEAFNFQGGDRLFIAGTVASADQARVTEFNADLRRAQVGGRMLFVEDGVDPPKFVSRGADIYRWDFTAKLNTPWIE